jgi:hypothetical protein
LRILTAGQLAALLCVPGLAWAQQAPTPTFRSITIQGGAATPVSVPTVAALRAFAPPSFPTTVRLDGYYAAGDGGGDLWQWSAGSSATDDGCGTIKAASATTGRWLRVIPAAGLDIRSCGAKPDGTTDAAPAIQAALTVATGQIVLVGPGPYRMNAGVTVPHDTRLQGTGYVGRFHSQSPLVTAVPGLRLITLSSGAYLGHLSIDMRPAGSGSAGSGTAVYTPAGTADVKIDDVFIDGGCIQADLNGNTISVLRSFLDNAKGTGCGGIRLGHETTATATTDPRIVDSTIAADVTADFNLRVEDAGGLYLSGNDFLYAKIGTYIVPGLNQWIAWLFASNTALSDSGTQGLVIDTADATAKVTGLQISGSWSSNNSSYNVRVRNSAGGVVSGIHFDGLRVYGGGASSDSVLLEGGTNITFDASHICAAASGQTAINLSSGVSSGAVRNSEVGGSCDGAVTTPAAGVLFNGSNSGWIVTGNNFTNDAAGVFGTPTGASIVKDNLPAAGTIKTIASASTLALTADPLWSVTGTASVSTINGAWNGRQVTFVPTAALPLVTGGNVCNAVTGAASVPISLTYTGTCWAAK